MRDFGVELCTSYVGLRVTDPAIRECANDVQVRDREGSLIVRGILFSWGLESFSCESAAQFPLGVFTVRIYVIRNGKWLAIILIYTRLQNYSFHTY